MKAAKRRRTTPFAAGATESARAVLRRYQGRLPAGFQFDREEADASRAAGTPDQPGVPTFAQALLAMPDVGDDADFARVDDTIRVQSLEGLPERNDALAALEELPERVQPERQDRDPFAGWVEGTSGFRTVWDSRARRGNSAYFSTLQEAQASALALDPVDAWAVRVVEDVTDEERRIWVYVNRAWELEP